MPPAPGTGSMLPTPMPEPWASPSEHLKQMGPLHHLARLASGTPVPPVHPAPMPMPETHHHAPGRKCKPGCAVMEPAAAPYTNAVGIDNACLAASPNEGVDGVPQQTHQHHDAPRQPMLAPAPLSSPARGRSTLRAHDSGIPPGFPLPSQCSNATPEPVVTPSLMNL